MTWEKWVLIGLYCYSTLATVNQIGKPRKPIEPKGAVAATLFSACLVALVVFA